MTRELGRSFGKLILVVGALVVFTFGAMYWRSARLLAEESAQWALLAEAEQLLAAYHREHGHYPETLGELAFTYRDGRDRSTLELLDYNTDGEYFIVKTIGTSSGEERRVCR